MLRDKVALVTGASSGIGKAVALRLAKAGARVCVNYERDVNDAQKVVDLLRNEGQDCFLKQADVSKQEDVTALVEAVVGRWGKIDILVNNAGVSGAGTTFMEITEEVWERMLNINLKSSFFCSKAALDYMMKEGYGRIINLSSIAGFASIVSSNAHYAASKAGIIALTKRLARDFASYNINVNCVAPGLIHDTGFNENMDSDVLAAYVRQIPKGRPGYTKDCAGIVMFLASDEADFITGQVIAVDGGTTC